MIKTVLEGFILIASIVFNIVLLSLLLLFLTIHSEDKNINSTFEINNKNIQKLRVQAKKNNEPILLFATGYTLSKDECNKTLTGATFKHYKLCPGKSIAISRDMVLKHGFNFGDRVYIYDIEKRESLGIRVVHDLMHKRFKNRCDILFFDKRTAKEFGKRKVNIVRIFD